MILANIQGVASIYNNTTDFIKDTFNPFIEYKYITLGTIKGRTYQERKENARQKAIDYSLNLETFTSGLSWGELYTIQCYFETIARKYGLIKEFKENAII